jgi:PAS domain S-box-containing protein
MISQSPYIRYAVLNQKVDTLPVRACLQENREVGGFWQDYRQVDVAGVSRCLTLEGYKWVLITEQDEWETLTLTRQMGLWSMIMGMVILISIAPLAYVTARFIFDPVVRFTAVADTISKGNLDVKIFDTEREDEIGVLARAFNHMVDSLTGTRKRLEEKNEELAASLTQFKQQNETLRQTKLSMLNIMEELKKEKSKLEAESVERIRAQVSIEANEERFRGITDSTQDAIITLDVKGHINFWNTAAERIFGYSALEVIGQPAHKILLAPQMYPAYLQRMEDFRLNTKGPVSYQAMEISMLHKDGREIPIEISLSSFKMRSRWQVIGVARDITARKKLEERLRLQSAALQHAANMIVITDTAGVIQWVNPAFEELTGYTRAEAVGQTPRILKSQTHEQTMYAQMWDGIVKGMGWRGEMVNKRKDGTLYDVDMTVTPVADEKGTIVAFIGISQDISERKRVEEGLRRQKKDLESVNKELDSFVYTASHDLRAPLRAISSFATFLEEDYKEAIGESGREYIEEIRRGADRMSRLIDDLLSLSRISRIHNPYEDAAVMDILNAVMDRLKYDIDESQAQVLIQGEMPVICCDRIKMTEAFANLISNAVKFSTGRPSADPQGPRVEIGYEDQERFHRFYVKDNGIGIDPEFHEKIFGVFKRLHTNAEYEGTGAGLSIVLKIIQEHQGRVWVDSRLGSGSTFYFTVAKDLKERKNTDAWSMEDGAAAKGDPAD